MRALVCGFLLFAAAVTAGKVKPPEGQYAPKCLVGTPGIYDPSKADEVPWYDVDLDAEPEEHYKKIVKDHIPGINRVIDIIKEMVYGVLGVLGDTTDIIGILETLSQDAFLNKIPKTYQREIQGIADATGVTTADLTMMNMYYELSRFCTSIIAQGADGTMYHARNLDFGQLFVWNVTTRSWALTDALKTVTININFMRGGKVLYKATTFAGHLGIITGMKPNAFTLSMNAKVKSDLAAVIQYLTGDVPDIHFAMWADREVMEQANTFEEARDFLSKIQQLAGCYYILGGAKPGQGTIIVRNETGVMQEKTLDGSPDKWFILQTNYDPDQVPLFIDDRQEPGESCMRTLSQKNLSPEGIYQVLASKTTLNKTTAHMVIMSLTTGLYETFIMYCADPCWFL